FFSAKPATSAPPSFPTRRSSDLDKVTVKLPSLMACLLNLDPWFLTGGLSNTFNLYVLRFVTPSRFGSLFKKRLFGIVYRSSSRTIFANALLTEQHTAFPT